MPEDMVRFQGHVHMAGLGVGTGNPVATNTLMLVQGINSLGCVRNVIRKSHAFCTKMPLRLSCNGNT